MMHGNTKIKFVLTNFNSTFVYFLKYDAIIVRQNRYPKQRRGETFQDKT